MIAQNTHLRHIRAHVATRCAAAGRVIGLAG